MSLDPLLPIAPARVKALVVPLGQIKRDRFSTFVDRLNSEHVVHLRDITADARPNRNMFSPLAFPDGAIFYELTTHVPPPSHLALCPFDLYRKPLALLAIADGAELSTVPFRNKRASSGSSTARTLAERNIRALYQELEDLRDAHPEILVHHVLIFDFPTSESGGGIPIPEEGIITIPPAEQHKRTTMKTVMCDISSLLLAEMTGLAKSFEAMKFIDSPGQSSTIRQLNGQDDEKLARRNSQYSMPTNSNRSSSASGLADRSQARMSMPPGAFRSVSNSSMSGGRPSTPVKSALGNELAYEGGRPSTEPRSSPEQALPAKRPEESRTQSADRVSVTGFGSGGLNERWRNKGRARVQVVTGSLYLQAGRWADSIRELVEGATVARSVNDHLWHGKALELILVNLILLGWAGLEFQVPAILLPAQPEKGADKGGDGIEIRDHTQPRWLRNLQVILPELVERILGLYSRISAEHLPPLPLAEATVRLARVLGGVHVADGLLAEKSLKMMVEGGTGGRVLTTSPRFTVKPTRGEIVTVLMRAFPGAEGELLTTVDRVVILSGVASTLGQLGFERKKAMVVRELVSVLIGGLVEARTRGAAEVGIHPAAGLMAINGHGGEGRALQLGEGDVEAGIDAFLGLLLKTYGVVTFDVLSDRVPSQKDGDEEVLGRISRQSAARHFGIKNVKLNILRACVNFSEALPDFAGVLRFSSDLLRTAGSGIAPGPKREDAAPVIMKEEQVRLVTNIVKTSNLAKRLGMGHLTAEYWDEFLVRGVKLEPLPASRSPVPHAKSVLPAVAGKERASQDVNPFIYNPFLKKDEAAAEGVLVAGEAATFRLTLQNPYEIEVDLESIRLDGEGVEFESSVTSAILGAYRTQVVRLTATAKAAGTLKITGAVVRVKGCRERRFPIFREPWSPEDVVKVKTVGLGALERHCAEKMTSGPKPESLELSVISQQPVVVVKSSTLPQSSVMILEGERQVFSVTLQNLSRTTPVDFILFSFQNSTQEALRQAMSNRDASAAELYEYELILAKKQALRLRKGPEGKEKKRFIPPGGTATWEFEILGRPGLTHGLIQIDYAYLGGTEEVGEKFYTRQVELELTVTVNASVEVARIDILPLQGVIPQPLWTRTGHKGDEKLAEDEYCLLMLDLRNSWPGHMVVQLEVEDGATIEEPILPGHTSRVVVPLKRIYLEDPHAFIPALNPSRQRQFVVSTKISPEVERANREAFWYRERILDSVKGTWSSVSGGRGSRTGQIELRSMRLTGRMIEALRVDDVGIEVTVEDPAATGKTNGNTIFVDEFAQLRVKVANRTDRPIYPLLRLAPALCHRPLLSSALDLTRKFAWNGTLQRTLPMIRGKSSFEEVIGVTALCRGEFEIGASVEETRLWTDEGEKKKGRPRSDTQSMMDAALGPKERRTWVCRRPARIVVRDREGS
ncbi:Trs120-domain-containing protein [Coniochaeta ligniaria NRRL 30616]|uniref:Trs120-domain-containing protein n=1 Tax=Coniochaeta ligniaria NRRL 30616 TaxID=1408157 RepID=A0A1J7IQ21_9PEZI|nr:Trs120-domain-containing protein [Coniochaeta ligniaria NRRL 30616]